MVVALSVHSVFEGLAIGLQTHYKPLFNLYLGVIIHEVTMTTIIMAMAMAMEAIFRKNYIN